jgi:hypothetical protein
MSLRIGTIGPDLRHVAAQLRRINVRFPSIVDILSILDTY